MIPDVIMDQYKLHDLVHHGHVYVEIRKDMYGLPQASRIAYNRPRKFLQPFGYEPTTIMPGLWRHKTRDISSTLVANNFGVKYTRKEDAQHLLATLSKLYVCSTDWTGSRYYGLMLAWDYAARTCEISMPGYVARAPQSFSHEPPTHPEHSPHAWQKPT
jgi:hypothetical protein